MKKIKLEYGHAGFLLPDGCTVGQRLERLAKLGRLAIEQGLTTDGRKEQFKRYKVEFSYWSGVCCVAWLVYLSFINGRRPEGVK